MKRVKLGGAWVQEVPLNFIQISYVAEKKVRTDRQTDRRAVGYNGS